MDKNEIEQILTSELGIGNFDVSDFKDMKNYTIYLKYPSITLTNTQGESHTIKDIFIRLHDSGRGYTSFSGVRGTVSQEEFGSGYHHSHLSSCITSFASFCLGSSELSILLSEGFPDSKEKLQYFLSVLHSYLSWESIEGNPYIRFNTITGFNKLYPMNKNEISMSLIEGITNNFKNIKVNLNFKVKNLEEVEDHIFKYIKGIRSLSRYIANRCGNLYVSNTKNEIPREIPFLLKFNNEDIFLKIEKNEEYNQTKSWKQCPHPTVTEVICDRITRDIKSYYITSSRIRPEISSGDTSRGMESGKVSM